MADDPVKLAEYRDRWLEIGLSKDPCDRAASERQMTEAYKSAGLKEPVYAWFGSPWAAIAARNFTTLLEEWRQSPKDLSVPIGVTTNGGTWAMIGDGLAALHATAGEELPSAEVCEALFYEAVSPSRMQSGVWDCGYGQHDANWLGYYEYMREVCGEVDATSKLVPLIEHAKVGGWYLPHIEVCFMSERPDILELDDQYRLHSRTGPALHFPDGWAVYAINNVKVPSYVVTNPEQITVQRIDEEQNLEVRTIMLGIFGMERFLSESGAIPVHADEYGSLYRRDMPGDEPLAMVCYTDEVKNLDGTPKRGFLRVPPDCETAHAAVAWTYHKDPKDYKPLLRT